MKQKYRWQRLQSIQKTMGNNQPKFSTKQKDTLRQMNTTKQSKRKKNHCWIVVNKWINFLKLLQQKHRHSNILNALTK
jgi:triphosphoribosyl-dephospho-CoA synthetase